MLSSQIENHVPTNTSYSVRYVRHALKSPLPVITEIEIPTMEAWLRSGAITLTDTGSENLYFVDQFDNQFFCKCYP